MQSFAVNGHNWKAAKDLPEHTLWHSFYWCSDGDGAELYIDKDNSGFTLECFSGIPASSINIDQVDFGSVWDLAKYPTKIGTHSFEEQCIMLADYFCRLFCEYREY